MTVPNPDWDEDSAGRRGAGGKKARKALTTLLMSGALDDTAEEALIHTAGQAGVYLDDWEAKAVVRENPDLTVVDRVKPVLTQTSLDQFTGGGE